MGTCASVLEALRLCSCRVIFFLFSRLFVFIFRFIVKGTASVDRDIVHGREFSAAKAFENSHDIEKPQALRGAGMAGSITRCGHEAHGYV